LSVFITFEGGEGSGKSSVIAMLKREFRRYRISYLATKEPGGTEIGEAIRNLLLDPAHTAFDPLAELMLYLASRKQHLEQLIKPALRENKVVLCDRYEDSSVAYQGHARGLGVDHVISLSRAAGIDQPPDLTFLLDVDPKIGLERAMGRSFEEITRFENEQMRFHEKVRQGYLKLAENEPDRFRIIDSSKPLEEVAETVISMVMERMRSRV
jgi:dTMP kinase